MERVEVLPFHQLGRFKYERLGISYQLQEAVPPSEDSVQRACELFRAAGLKAY